MAQKYLNAKETENRIRKREELAKRYAPDWRICGQVFHHPIEEHLGELDADVEWNNDARGACERFLNTNAYVRFKQSNNIVLVGRTGTGKSSILNRYEFAVNQEKSLNYDFAVSIKFERFFKLLKMYSMGDFDNTAYEIKDAIIIIINLHIMQHLVCNYSIIPGVEQLKNFLCNVGIYQDTNIIDCVCVSLRKYQENDNLKEVVTAFRNIYDYSINHEIQQLYKDLVSKYKILVLADSMDNYDITDKRIVIISKALLDLAFECLNSRDAAKRFILKIAIPSEVYTHVSEHIPAKNKSKEVVIEWSYKDLVRVLAIKILFCFQKVQHPFIQEIIEKYTIEDFADFNQALAFLHEMLPQECRASIPLTFDTISYCLRHTQKKPRQIINIFNIFVDEILEQKDIRFFIEHSDIIHNYIHKAQEDIINDALNMYNVMAKHKVLSIIQSVLYKRKNFMNEKELNEAIRGASSLFDPLGLSTEDIKTILIESGLIGKVSREGYVEENNEKFNNVSVLKVSIAQFEYQLKQTLPDRDGDYVLHPMCYEFYVNEIDCHAFVYPEPANDISDDIIDTLEQQNYIL